MINPHALISMNDANKAIYIDFEGFVDKSPSLLGILKEDNFEQVVFDINLISAAEAKSLRYAELDEEIERIIKCAKKEHRYIVAYSQHELRVIKTYTSFDITEQYRDARMIAKRWKNKCLTLTQEQKSSLKTLKDYLAFIHYERGAFLGENQSTSRLKSVIDMSIKRGEYSNLTAVAKGKWTKLLKHNEIDCKGMKALVLKAAKEIEERSH
jgi:hypothetical protein